MAMILLVKIFKTWCRAYIDIEGAKKAHNWPLVDVLAVRALPARAPCLLDALSRV